MHFKDRLPPQPGMAIENQNPDESLFSEANHYLRVTIGTMHLFICSASNHGIKLGSSSSYNSFSSSASSKDYYLWS